MSTGGLPNAPSHKADLAEGVQPVCCGSGLCDADALGGPGVHTPHKARQNLGVAVIKAPRHRPELARWQAAQAKTQDSLQVHCPTDLKHDRIMFYRVGRWSGVSGVDGVPLKAMTFYAPMYPVSLGTKGIPGFVQARPQASFVVMTAVSL